MTTKRLKKDGTPWGKTGGAQPRAGRPTKAVTIAKTAMIMAEGMPRSTKANRRPPRKPLAETPNKNEALVKKSRRHASRILDGGVLGALKNGDLDPNATPLDVMIEAMRQAYKIGGAIMAAPFAKEAAPYVHGKVNNIDLKQTMQQGQAMQGSDQPVHDIGLHRFLVEYVDVEDVTPKELTDGSSD